MRIYEVKNYDELSRKAADIIAAQILIKPDCVLGLATGSTPVGAYKELIQKYENGDLDFPRFPPSTWTSTRDCPAITIRATATS